MPIITYDQVQSKIIEIRNQKVILDIDVADLYGVKTREINQAVKRNPSKFPAGYLMELTAGEWEPLKSQIVTSIKGGKMKVPIAFTERGLYMLATVLKGSRAIATTIAIIETFAKLKELIQTVYLLAKAPNRAQKVKIFENSTEIMADLLDNPLTFSQQQTNFKIKLPFFEISRTITRIKK